jgi:hypothetical protein
VHGIVEQNAVVDLVAEQQQRVLSSDLDDPSSTSREYTAPVGLFGLMTTIALVAGVTFDRMSSRSGCQPFSLSQR